MDQTEKRIAGYGSLLIALLINTPKLLALRENGIMAHYWHFNLWEILFQMGFNLILCGLLFGLSLNTTKSFRACWLANVLLIMTCLLIGGFSQQLLFDRQQQPGIYWAGFITRMVLSGALVGILVRIIRLIRAARHQQAEHEQLKSTYFAAELELLKQQMNPHFLFNALSSLSGLVRENQELAQQYLRELSQVFRYSLTQSSQQLVTLQQELTMLHSFAQLIRMRLETAFLMEIYIPDAFLQHQLPHLSLQPLLENAVKHNVATTARPLKVQISVQDGHLVVSNNLWELGQPEVSSGLGLVNLNQRFKLMTGQEIAIFKTNTTFTVKLPLKK